MTHVQGSNQANLFAKECSQNFIEYEARELVEAS